jgi:hypothetical protein
LLWCEGRKLAFDSQFDLAPGVFALLPALRLPRFFPTTFFSAFFAKALRRLTSSREYMVPRHFLAPQLHTASSSPPS